MIWHRPRSAFAGKVDSYAAVEVLSADALHERYNGKIVLRGVAEGLDEHVLAFGGTRSGVQLHAEAASSLLAKNIVRAPTGTAQVVLLLLVALVAMAIRVWMPSVKWRRTVSLAVLVLFVAAGVYAYVDDGILLNVLNGVLMFWTVSYAAGLVNRGSNHANRATPSAR